ncbi:MAG: TonB-dependent receptor [Acidobacteriota bacterium]
MTNKRWIFGLLLALCGAMAAGAENDRTSGTVVDPQGRPIAGATVELISADGETLQSVRTGNDGTFRFEGSAPGATLAVRARGFETVRQGAAEQFGRIELPLAAVRQELLVTAGSPDLATELQVSADELERASQNDLAEALRGTPGLSAVRRGPVNLEPSIRGLQESQVAMFVDGTRTFAAGPARMDSDLSHVGLHAAEQVRVVKGPYALTWGSGALSAIQVNTAAPVFSSTGFNVGGSAGLGWNDNASAGGHGSVAISGSRIAGSLFAERLEGDDYEDGDGFEVPGDFVSSTGRWRLAADLADGLVLDLSGGYQQQEDIDYPGRLLDASYFYTRSHALSLQAQNRRGTFSELYGQLWVNRKDHRMNNDEKPTARPMAGRIPPFALRVDLPTESNAAGGRFHAATDGERWRWKVGGDAYRSEQMAQRRIFRRAGDGTGGDRLLFNDIVWPEAEIENQGVYAQVVRSAAAAEISLGVRVDRIDASAGEVSDFFRANTSGDLDQAETHVSAAVSGRWRLTDRWSATAGIGRAVRTATVLERYSDRFPASKFQASVEFMGNPALDPETSLELDLGSQWSAGDFWLDVATFYRQIDDYITIVPDPTLPKRLPLSPPTVFRYINGDSATFWGGELTLRQQPSENFTWYASASYTRGEDDLLDEPVLGIEPLTGQLGLTVRSAGGRWWGDLSATFAERQDRVAIRRFEIETSGYTTVNLLLGTEVRQGLKMEVGAENLLDEAYADHLNARNPFTGQRIQEPGRAAFVRVKLDF